MRLALSKGLSTNITIISFFTLTLLRLVDCFLIQNSSSPHFLRAWKRFLSYKKYTLVVDKSSHIKRATCFVPCWIEANFNGVTFRFLSFRSDGDNREFRFSDVHDAWRQ